MKCTCKTIACCDLETQEWEHEIVECEYCAKLQDEHAEMLVHVKHYEQIVQLIAGHQATRDILRALIARVEGKADDT